MTQLLHDTSASRHVSDQEAARLYAEYGDRILRYCRGQLRSVEEAEDAVQNTFLRVTTAMRKGVVPEFEGPWLYKIAHNVCLSRRLGSSRRARVETPADIDALADCTAAYTPDADELFGLDDALADMPPNLRRPLLLREWQGMSYLEIAEALEVSHSAVESLIFRARRHLAQALTDSVKKTGRAIASVLPFRWLVEALRGLGGGVSGGGLAAGAAALVVAIGGGVAIDLTTQGAHASHARGAEAAVHGEPAAATPVRAGADASAAARVQGATLTAGAASHAVGVGRHAAAGGGFDVAPGGGAARGAGPGGAETPAGTDASSPSGAAARSAGNSPSKAASPSKAGGGSTSRRAVPGKDKASPRLPIPSAPSLPPAPSLPDPGSLLPPVSVPPLPAVPAVPALPDPPIIDPPALPPVPPASVPPVPPVPVPPVPPLPPVAPLPPAPPLPPLPPPLAPVAPAAAHGAVS